MDSHSFKSRTAPVLQVGWCQLYKKDTVLNVGQDSNKSRGQPRCASRGIKSGNMLSLECSQKPNVTKYCSKSSASMLGVDVTIQDEPTCHAICTSPRSSRCPSHPTVPSQKGPLVHMISISRDIFQHIWEITVRRLLALTSTTLNDPTTKAVAQSLKYRLPMQKVGGSKTWQSQTNDLENVSLSLPILLLCITRIGQERVSSVL